MATATTSPTEPHPIQCMEIWGGNRAIDNALSVVGIDAWVFSDPVDHAPEGGDLHYVSMCGMGKISRFAVADVSGHGPAVGELAVSLRGLMRKYINTVDQSRFVRRLNEEFSRLASAGRFATALLTSYYAPTDHLVVCNAGHPPPLWYRAGPRTWQFLEHDAHDRAPAVSNLPLGVIEPTDYHQFAVELGLGDLILIYSDSLIEAESPQTGLLGGEGLLEIVRQLDVSDPSRVHHALLDRIDAYRGGRPAHDDVTLIVLHHNGADPPRPSLGQMAKSVAKMMGILKV